MHRARQHTLRNYLILVGVCCAIGLTVGIAEGVAPRITGTGTPPPPGAVVVGDVPAAGNPWEQLGTTGPAVAAPAPTTADTVPAGAPSSSQVTPVPQQPAVSPQSEAETPSRVNVQVANEPQVTDEPATAAIVEPTKRAAPVKPAEPAPVEQVEPEEPAVEPAPVEQVEPEEPAAAESPEEPAAPASPEEPAESVAPESPAP